MMVNNFVCSFQTCCFFYPLRKGLLVWGYLNLIRYCVQDGISAGLTGDRIPLHSNKEHGIENEDLLSLIIVFAVTLVLATANLVFNVVFILGMHKRDERLLRPHYYYWMVTVALYMVVFVAANMLKYIFEPFYIWLSLHLDLVTYHMTIERPLIGIVDIVVQIYFLVLVRNQIRILDKGDERPIIDYDFEGTNPRPQTVAETVRNVIETQPSLNTHRF